MVVAIAPRSINVVAAFLPLGLRKAGTPLAMASTPVSAAQPEAKARSSRKAAAAPVNPSAKCSSGTSWRSALGALPRVPVAHCTKPHAAMPSTAAMNA